jgi:hypothetical protein
MAKAFRPRLNHDLVITLKANRQGLSATTQIADMRGSVRAVGRGLT